MENVEIGEVFTISDEDDQEQEVEVVAVINLEGTQYVAVSFVEDLEEDTEEDMDVFFLKVDQEGDLDAIESDEEFTKVSNAFEELWNEENA